MKLAKYKIINIDAILAGSRINRIDDKAVKDAVVKAYIALKRVANEATSDKDEITRKFQEDWWGEMVAVKKFRDAKQPVVGHLDYLEAERDANNTISDLLKEEVDIDITPVPADAIMAVSEDITLEQVALLQEYGVIE